MIGIDHNPARALALAAALTGCGGGSGQHGDQRSTPLGATLAFAAATFEGDALSGAQLDAEEAAQVGASLQGTVVEAHAYRLRLADGGAGPTEVGFRMLLASGLPQAARLAALSAGGEPAELELLAFQLEPATPALAGRFASRMPLTIALLQSQTAAGD